MRVSFRHKTAKYGTFTQMSEEFSIKTPRTMEEVMQMVGGDENLLFEFIHHSLILPAMNIARKALEEGERVAHVGNLRVETKTSPHNPAYLGIVVRGETFPVVQ